MRALVVVASATTGVEFESAARTPEVLGIAGMSREELLRYAATGEAPSR
jgi:hypothetical protein